MGGLTHQILSDVTSTPQIDTTKIPINQFFVKKVTYWLNRQFSTVYIFTELL